VNPREFRYSIALDRAGRMTADGDAPEHLVLEGLARCTLQSLRFHADRSGIDFVASATASGLVTKPASAERYSFVEIDVRVDVELEPVPSPDALRELLELAERDCFVGASLRPHPNYHWYVNGEAL
jgi:organic hydroperoxide reductase OsmC/OhrA